MTAVSFCYLFERVHVYIQTPLRVTLLTPPYDYILLETGTLPRASVSYAGSRAI